MQIKMSTKTTVTTGIVVARTVRDYGLSCESNLNPQTNNRLRLIKYTSSIQELNTEIIGHHTSTDTNKFMKVYV